MGAVSETAGAKRGRAPFLPLSHAVLRERIKALYHARNHGLIEDYCSHFAPDARVKILGDPFLNPGSGLLIGREAIAVYIADLRAQNFYGETSIDAILFGESTIGVRWTQQATCRSNGVGAPYALFDHMVIADGLIVEMCQFYDSLRVAQHKNRLKGDTAAPKTKGGAKTPPS